MTGSQYNNVVRWTLANMEAADSLTAARAVFNNCGVAFPQGSCRDILLTLMSGEYMGWAPCTYAQAQEFANAGIAAVGIDTEHVVILLPDETAVNRASSVMSASASAYAADSVAATERMSMQFYAYSAASTTTTVQPSTPSEPESLMTRDEYYNNIHATELIYPDESTYCNIWVHKVLDTCGIPYPTGGCTAELQQYADGYDTWLECDFQAAQSHANQGKATIGITYDHVVMVTPNDGTIPTVVGQVLVSQSGAYCFYDQPLSYSWTANVRGTIRFFYYNK